MPSQNPTGRPPAGEWREIAESYAKRDTRPRDKRRRLPRPDRPQNQEPRQRGIGASSKTTKVVALLVFIALAGVSGVLVIYVQSNEAPLQSIQAQSAPLPAVSTPTATATPQPTWTPRPRPPTATPTVVIPIATLAVSTLAPTPKPIDWTAYYVELFADCNGRYAGEEKENGDAPLSTC